jgi:hypothetical protein
MEGIEQDIKYANNLYENDEIDGEIEAMYMRIEEANVQDEWTEFIQRIQECNDITLETIECSCGAMFPDNTQFIEHWTNN